MKIETRHFRLKFQLALKMLLSPGSNIFSFQGLMTGVGLSVGVACLYVSMSVMSGFEKTLLHNLSDITGHIQVVRATAMQDDLVKVYDQVSTHPNVKSSTSYLYQEGLLASSQGVQGVIVQGLPFPDCLKTLNLESRLIAGDFKKLSESLPVESDEETPIPVVVGKGLAARYSFKLGDPIKVVIPEASSGLQRNFKRKVLSLQITGLMDLGKYDYNERWILVNQASLQKKLNSVSLTGFLLQLKDPDDVKDTIHDLEKTIPYLRWRLKDWRELNDNLLRAVQMERLVVFFVIFIIVLAAGFNVSSLLNIFVLNKTSDLSLLQSMGFSKKDVIHMIVFQGLVFATLGLIGGTLLGAGLSETVMFLQNEWSLLPGSIYKIERIETHLRVLDALLIVFSTYLICLGVTYMSAIRASRLSVSQGLRYE